MDGSLGTAMGRLGLDTSDLESGYDRAAAKADQFAGKSGQIASSLQQVGAGVAAFGGVVTAGFGVAIKTAANFEFQINAIQAVLSPEQWQQYGKAIEDTALRLGQDYPVSALEAAAAMEELAKQGISAENIIAGAGEAVVLLSNATGTDLVRSAEIASVAMNQFGYAGEDMIMVADVLTNAANASSLSVDDLGYALGYVGNSASNLGYDLDDTSTAIAMLSDRGIQASRAGTGLRMMLMRLASPTATGAGLMDELGLSMGGVNSVIDEQTGSMRPLEEVIHRVAKATANMGEVERAQYLNKIFGVQGGEAMLALLLSEEEAAKGARRSWQDYNEEINAVGTAKNAAQIRMEGLRGAIELMRGALDTLMVRVGSVFIPVFESVVRAVANVVDKLANLPTPILTAIAVIGALTGVTALLVGGLMLAAPAILGFFKSLELLRGVGGLSNIFRIMRKDIANVVPAMTSKTKAIRTQSGVEKAAITTSTGLSSALRGLLVAVKPIAGAVLIAGAAWFAWQKNFLGIRDAAQAVGSALGKLGSYFSEVWRTGDQVNGALSKMPGWLQGIASALGSVLAPFGKFMQMWNWLGDQGGGDAPATPDAPAATGGGATTVAIGADTTAFDSAMADAEATVGRFVGTVEDANGKEIRTVMRLNDFGVPEEIGRIVETVEGADGTEMRVRVETDDGDYWATIDAVTGQVIPDKTTTITANMEVSGDDKVIEWVENPEALDGTGFDYMVRIKNPDGSLEEFGQIIESYTDESDPNIAHIKVKTDTGEYWTTVDKTTGVVGDATIEVGADTSGATAAIGDLNAEGNVTVGMFDRILNSLGAFRAKADELDRPFLVQMVDGLITAVEWVENVIGYFEELQSIYEIFSGRSGAENFDETGEAAGRTGGIMAGLNAVVAKLSQDFPVLGAIMRGVMAVVTALIPVVQGLANLFMSALGVALDVVGWAWDAFGKKLLGFMGIVAIVKVGIGLLSTVWAGLGLILSPIISLFMSIVRPLMSLLNVFRLVGAAIAFLTSPIALVVAAITLFAMAYQKNFMGFGDLVDRVFSRISALVTGFTDVFKRAWSVFEGDNPIERFIKSVAAGFAKIGEMTGLEFFTDIAHNLTDLGKVLGKVAKKIKDFAHEFQTVYNLFRRMGDTRLEAFFGALEVALRKVGFDKLADLVAKIVPKIEQLKKQFQYFTSQGLNPLQAAIAVLQVQFPKLARVFEAVGSVLQALWDLFVNVVDVVVSLGAAFLDLLSGDWDGLIDNLKEAWSGLGDIFGSIWELIKAGATLLIEMLKALPWDDIWDGIVAAASALGGLIADAAGDIWAWIKENFPDWMVVVGDLVVAAGEALADLGSKLAEVAGPVWDWIVQKVREIPWSSVFGTLYDAGKMILGWVWDGIKWTWDNVILPFFKTAWNAISEWIPWDTIKRVGTDIITEIYNGISDAWSAVIDWFGDIGSKIWSGITGIWDTIKGIGGQIVESIKVGIDKAWSGIETFLSDRLERLGNVFMPWKNIGDEPASPTQAPTQAPTQGPSPTVATGAASKYATMMIEAMGDAMGSVSVVALSDGIHKAYERAVADIVPGDLLTAAKRAGEAFIDATDLYFGGTSGTTLWQGIRKAFDKVPSQVKESDLQAGADLTGDAFLKAVRTYFDDGTSGTTLAGGIAHAFWVAGGVLAPLVTDDAKLVGETFLLEVGNYLQTGTGGQTLSGGIATSFTKAASTIGTQLDAPAKTVGEAFVTALAIKIPAADKSQIRDAVGTLINNAFLAGTGTAVTTAAETVATAFVTALATKLATSLSDAETRINTFVLNTQTSMSGWKNSVTSSISKVEDALDTTLPTALAAGKNNVSSFVGTTTTAFGVFRTDVGRKMGETTGVIRQATLDWKTSLNSAANDAKSKATTLGNNVRDGVKSGLESATANIGAQARGWPQLIRNQDLNMYNAGRYVGEQAGKGVVGGLAAYNDDVDRAAQRLINTATAAMRLAAQTRSPSRITLWIGEMLVRGLVIALEAGESPAVKAARSLVNALDTTLSSLTFDSLSGAIDMAMKNVPTTVTTPPVQMPSTMMGQLMSTMGRGPMTTTLESELLRLLSMRQSVPATALAQTSTQPMTVNMPITINDASDPKKTAETVVSLLSSVAMQTKAGRAVTLGASLGHLG